MSNSTDELAVLDNWAAAHSFYNTTGECKKRLVGDAQLQALRSLGACGKLGYFYVIAGFFTVFYCGNYLRLSNLYLVFIGYGISFS